MRRGYWRTLLGKLRHKVAAGENAFAYSHGEFVIDVLSADDDAALESGEVRLAEDAQGNGLVVDLGTTAVTMVDAKNGERLGLSSELAAFVDALHCTSALDRALGLELGPVVDEWDAGLN